MFTKGSNYLAFPEINKSLYPNYTLVTLVKQSQCVTCQIQCTVKQQIECGLFSLNRKCFFHTNMKVLFENVNHILSFFKEIKLYKKS